MLDPLFSVLYPQPNRAQAGRYDWGRSGQGQEWGRGGNAGGVIAGEREGAEPGEPLGEAE